MEIQGVQVFWLDSILATQFLHILSRQYSVRRLSPVSSTSHNPWKRDLLGPSVALPTPSHARPRPLAAALAIAVDRRCKDLEEALKILPESRASISRSSSSACMPAWQQMYSEGFASFFSHSSIS